MDVFVATTLRPRTWSTPKIELRLGDEGLGVFAVLPICEGDVLIALAHVFVDRPERHTIQLDAHLHQAGTGEIDDYLNHSCEPNCALNFERLELVALRPLAVGEELSFNYLSSEWDMAAPFDCQCGAPGCQRRIRGLRHLGPAQQDALAPQVSPYLRRCLAEQRARLARAG